ncbi:hypothetical protein O6H91_03G100700 [Diphasiastrum complanatum]|uniref:Uncharacterized protein n=1 Tax=Diphasiastrum complanatum TaxID=34168 RepID=A0ACC2EAA3_DIPCM|nr:hypothetical protein O6H91_03G100700 [Diphasiastrum complanatum]
MAHPCADNLNLILYPPSEASLLGMTHQQFQIQSQQLSLSPFYGVEPNGGLMDSWPILQNWQLWNSSAAMELSAPNPRFSSCVDPLQDLCCSGRSYPLEPTSVPDLSSPSLESMHCLQASYSNKMGEGFDPRLLREDEIESCSMQYYSTAEEMVVEMMAPMDDGSSKWMDGIMDDLRQRETKAALLASCFDKNACESTQSCSDLPGYACSPAGEEWKEEFDLFCCSSDGATPSWPPQISTQTTAIQSGGSSELPPQCSISLASQQLSLQVVPTPPEMQHDLGSAEQDETSQEFIQKKSGKEMLALLKGAGFLGLKSEKEGGQRLKLVELLLDCVEAIDEKQESGKEQLRQLKIAASPTGDSLQRLASYFADGLEARLATSTLDSASISCEDENLEDFMIAYKHFNEACPYIKFAHLTANQAILDAAEAAKRIHIIDCGILQGVQWSALLQAFAALPGGVCPPKIRITGIASWKLGMDPASSLLATGKRLTEFAGLLNLEFEFCPITTKLEDLHASLLTLDENEVLAVNAMLQLNHLLDDELNCLKRVLKIVQEFRPRVVTIGECDANINSGSLQTRFMNAFQFYSAILDSLDATMGVQEPERLKMERLFFPKEIKSMVTYDGAQRQGRRESIENWRSILEAAGFSSGQLSHYAMSQARLLLWPYCEGFTLIEAPGCLSLGWMGHPIMAVSTWHC